MRLLKLVDFDRPQGGSFVPFLLAILDEAKGRGWETDLVLFESARSCDWIDAFLQQGTRVHFASECMRGSDRQLARWLADLVAREADPFVMHCHFHGFDVAAASVARRHDRAALVWHIHSVYPDSRWQAARTMLKFGTIGRRVDAYLCPAENIAADTVRRLAPDSKVHFVPSAIEVDAFPLADAEARRASRVELGLPVDRPILLHLGWHWYLKGGDIFLESVSAVRELGLREVIAIERGGHDEYVEYARRLGIEDHLIVLDPVERMTTLHAAADVMVCSSRMEGMAYGLLEALCTGTPVVATDIPGHAYVGGHVEACRIAGHDPEAIAAMVTETLECDAETAAAQALAARHWIADTLSTDVAGRELVDRYEALLASRAGRP